MSLLVASMEAGDPHATDIIQSTASRVFARTGSGMVSSQAVSSAEMHMELGKVMHRGQM